MKDRDQHLADSWAVTQIFPKDARFPDVIALWRQHRKNLGLFPEGAFEACAADGFLLGAFHPDGELAGYLSYRIHRRLNRAAIVHLCVETSGRGKGVSDALFFAVRDAATERGLDYILLKCRRDYEVDAMWKRFGFIVRGETPGRGEDGAVLTIWVFSFNSPTLFTKAAEQDARLKVVLDANVFFDLHSNDGSRNQEALPLREPWLDHEIELCVVDEMHNEIDGHSDPQHRAHLHGMCHRYTELSCSDDDWRKRLGEVEEILGPHQGKERERADRRQLAKSAAPRGQVFVTRDGELLKSAAELEAKLGVKVMRPADLLSSLDEIERALAYQPARLAGTNLQLGLLAADEIGACLDCFQSTIDGETRAQFAAKLRQIVAHVRATPPCKVTIIRDHEGVPLALVGVRDAADGQVRKVLLFRVARTQLAATLARHLVLAQVQASARLSRPLLHFCDECLSSIATEALRELNFVQSSEGWWRTALRFEGDATGVEERLRALASSIPAEISAHWINTLSQLRADEIENRCWPAKIVGSGVEAFVVPIRPYWAAQLFDEALAGEDLFGAFARLALNRENVYYRSAQPCGIRVPGRILWYVSRNDDYTGTMAIRACSRLLSVEGGPVKEIFAKHRRLGIYSWKEVFETAGNDPTGNIMALRFADTELFTSPVRIEDIRSTGIRSQFQSPTKVTEDQFLSIYRKGSASTSS